MTKAMEQIRTYTHFTRFTPGSGKNRDAKPGFRIARKPEVHRTRDNQLISAEILNEINTGALPDLRGLCYQLIDTFTVNNFPFKATQFIHTLRGYELTEEAKATLLAHPEKKHVILHNDLIKIVVIRWAPGEYYPVHGHPAGGCVFKVLQGTLQEDRYAPLTTQMLSRTKMMAGAVGYIDDGLAFHAIRNQHKTVALSLHAYTPGKTPS